MAKGFAVDAGLHPELPSSRPALGSAMQSALGGAGINERSATNGAGTNMQLVPGGAGADTTPALPSAGAKNSRNTIDRVVRTRDREHTPRFGVREQSPIESEYRALHIRFGHLGKDRMKSVLRQLGLWRKKFDLIADNFACNSCERAAFRTHNRPPERDRPVVGIPLARVYVDSVQRTSKQTIELSGKGRVATPVALLHDVNFVHEKAEVRPMPYAIMLRDEATRFEWALPIKSKNTAEVAAALDEWVQFTVPRIKFIWHVQHTRLQNQLIVNEDSDPFWAAHVTHADNIRLCALHMDVGSEFFDEVGSWARASGVDLQPGDPDQPWRNGVVEGAWRDVQSLMVKAQLDVTGAQAYNLWLPTLLYAVHMINLQPTSAPVAYGRPYSSPYERLTGDKPKAEWFFKFGEPCWFKDPSRTTKSTPKGMAGYIVGYQLLGDRLGRRGFMILPGDWDNTPPTHRRLIMRTEVHRDALALDPLHVGSDYMQPGQAGNPAGVTFTNAPDRPPPVPVIPRAPRRGNASASAAQHPEYVHTGAGGLPTSCRAPTPTTSGAQGATLAPSNSQGAPDDASADNNEDAAPQDAQAQGANDAPSADPPADSSVLDAPSVGEAESEDQEVEPEIQAGSVEGEFVDALDDTFTLEGSDLVQADDSDLQDHDDRDLPDEASPDEDEAPKPTLRRSSRPTAGVPPTRFGEGAYYASPMKNNPEAGHEAIDPSKLTAEQRKLLKAIKTATSETASGALLLDPRALQGMKPSKVRKWVLSLDIKTRINILELCSGRNGGSIRRALRRAGVLHLFNHCRVDSDPKCSPEVLMKVEDLAKAIENGSAPDIIMNTTWHIIWCSPPCTLYSSANSRRDKRKVNSDMELADSTVKACFEIIDMLKPICWFVENPDSGAHRLRDRPFMAKYRHLMNSVTYCRYGREDRKATLIVSNVPLSLLDCRMSGQECMTKKLLGRHTRTAQAGPSVAADGTVIPGTPQLESQQVPEALIEHIFDTALHTFGSRFEHALIDTAHDARAQLLVAAAKATILQSPTTTKLSASAYAVLGISEQDLGAKVRSIREVPKEEIMAAKEKEISGLLRKKVFTVVKKTDVEPDAQIMSYVWALKVRDDNVVKARLCVGGHRQSKGQNFWEISSPTPRASTVKLALAEAAMRDADIFTADVSQAYVAAPIGVRLYMRMPPEMEERYPGSVLLLHMSLYGAKQSGRNWFQEATRILCEELGYTQLQKDPCMFLWRNANGTLRETILLYVDDFLFLGARSNFDAFMNSMSKHVEITAGTRDRNIIKVWNGLELCKRQDGKIAVTQVAKVRSIAREFSSEVSELEGKSSAKATSPEYSNENNFDPRDMVDPKNLTARERDTIRRYQEMIGSLMYVATYTRFDIAYAMNKASRLMHAASEKHIRGAARIIKYLQDNESVPLIFDGKQCDGDGEPKVFCFVDSDFGGEPFHTNNVDDLGRKSSSACIIMCGGAAIFWKSKLQKKVALASGEAEFRALSYALKEVVFCIYLLAEMGFNPRYVPIFCDASVGVAQAKRDGLSWVEGTKQYEIELSAAYQMCREGMIMPLKISTDENPADLLTKSDPGGPEVRRKHIARISGTSLETFQTWIKRQLASFEGSSVSRHGHVSKSDFERICGLTGRNSAH